MFPSPTRFSQLQTSYLPWCLEACFSAARPRGSGPAFTPSPPPLPLVLQLPTPGSLLPGCGLLCLGGASGWQCFRALLSLLRGWGWAGGLSWAAGTPRRE